MSALPVIKYRSSLHQIEIDFSPADCTFTFGNFQSNFRNGISGTYSYLNSYLAAYYQIGHLWYALAGQCFDNNCLRFDGNVVFRKVTCPGGEYVCRNRRWTRVGGVGTNVFFRVWS